MWYRVRLVRHARDGRLAYVIGAGDKRNPNKVPIWTGLCPRNAGQSTIDLCKKGTLDVYPA